MKNTLTILFFIFLLSCSRDGSDKLDTQRVYADLIETNGEGKLNMVSHDPDFRYDSSCGFINKEGDTIIPFGKYHIWDTVNFVTYAIVKDSSGLVGINRDGEIMFDAFLYGDFQVDQPSEGMFRVKRNGKIGFANSNGKVVIPCIYSCAEHFQDGKAKVALNCKSSKDNMSQVSTESSDWFFINKKGERH